MRLPAQILASSGLSRNLAAGDVPVVIWMPGQVNLGNPPTDYSFELEVHGRSLAATYDREKVHFFYSRPSPELLAGIAEPKIANSRSVTFDQWPKGLRDVARQLGAAARKY